VFNFILPLGVLFISVRVFVFVAFVVCVIIDVSVASSSPIDARRGEAR